MFLLKIAGRNLFRNTKRSVLSMITIIVGVMGFIQASGLVEGIEQTYIHLEIASESAHIRILPQGYLKDEENLPIDITLKQPQKIVKAITQKFPKAIVVPRIIFSAEVGDGVYTLRTRGIAIEPKAFEKAFKFSQFTRSKVRLPESGNVMYLGSQIAKSFKKKTGDTMTIVVRTQAGSINAIDFKIIGLLSVGNILVDNFSLYIPLKTGRSFLGMKKDVTDLVVKLPSKTLAPQVAKIVEHLEPLYNTKKTYLDLNAELSNDTKLLKTHGFALKTSEIKHFLKISKISNLFVSSKEGNILYLSDKIAKTLKKKVGETITLAVKNSLDILISKEFKIKGLFSTKDLVKKGDFAFVMPFRAGRQLLKKYKPITWWMKAQDIIALNKLRRKFMNFLIAIILLVAASGVANMMLMSGFERKGEIGMMMALGMPTSRIMSLFTFEAAFLGVIGSLIGAFIGSVVVYYLQVHGIDLSGRMGAMDSSQGMMTISSMIYFKFIPYMAVIGTLVGIFVSILSALWPAWRITRFEPYDILSKN